MTTLVLSSSTLLISLAHSRSSLSVNNGGRPFYREVPSVYPSASLSTRKAHAHRLGRHRVGDELCGRSALQRDAGSSR